jgi:AraC family transcriptional regulator of arabinose operon
MQKVMNKPYEAARIPVRNESGQQIEVILGVPERRKTEKLKNVLRENLKSKRGATEIGDVLYGPGGTCGPRIQHDYQLVVIHEGSLNLLLDGKPIRVAPNHGILLCPGHREHFFFSTCSETRHSWCAIEPKAVPMQLRSKLKSYLGPIPFAGRMLSLLEMGKRELLTTLPPAALYEGFYLGIALATICDFAIAAQSGVSNTASESVLAKMMEYISKNYAERLSLQDVARAAGVSRQHLLKACRSEGKPTPMTQLYSVRLEVATDLLRQTGLSIETIAGKCGFVSAFHFSRRFKEAFGLSPIRWRKECWQTSEAAAAHLTMSR